MAAVTDAWSVVGGTSTRALPSKATRPSWKRGGSWFVNSLAAFWAAAMREGVTSVACMEAGRGGGRGPPGPGRLGLVGGGGGGEAGAELGAPGAGVRAGAGVGVEEGETAHGGEVILPGVADLDGDELVAPGQAAQDRIPG